MIYNDPLCDFLNYDTLIRDGRILVAYMAQPTGQKNAYTWLQRPPLWRRDHSFTRAVVLAYPRSYGNLEERMAERGAAVDHTHVYHWVQNQFSRVG